MSTNIGKWQKTKPFSKDLLIHLYSNFLFGFYLELAATWIQWFSVISLYLKIHILHYNIYKIILWFHKMSVSKDLICLQISADHGIIMSSCYQQIMESSCHQWITESSYYQITRLPDHGIIMSSCYYEIK